MPEQEVTVILLQDIIRGLVGQDTRMSVETWTAVAAFLEHVIEAKSAVGLLCAAAGRLGPECQERGLLAFSMANRIKPMVLYLITENNVLITGALVIGHSINRIGTLDTYRGKGYATKLIKCIEAIAIQDKWPELFSPVDPNAQNLFKGLDWEFARENPNPDGSHDMKPKWSAY
jgi:GNAT superfamily N-acetyltransferase